MSERCVSVVRELQPPCPLRFRNGSWYIMRWNWEQGTA